jgi:hypothetical protein
MIIVLDDVEHVLLVVRRDNYRSFEPDSRVVAIVDNDSIISDLSTQPLSKPSAAMETHTLNGDHSRVKPGHR